MTNNASDTILGSICDAIGQTPMLKLSRIGRDVPADIFGKLEFLNPGGSVKDRIGARMIEEAEKEGRIKPGDLVMLEAFGGGFTWGAALLRY